MFARNSAGYAAQGVVYNPNGRCVVGSGLSLYGNGKGIQMNPDGVTAITIKDVIASDNSMSIRTRVSLV